MQRAVNHLANGREIEGICQLRGHAQRVGGQRPTALADHDVERVGGDVVLSEIGAHAIDAGRARRGNRRVPEIGGNQLFELRDQVMNAFGRQIQAEQFDRDQPIALGFVRTEHWTQSTSADLMKHAKWTEGIRGRSAGSFRVQ